MAEQKIAPKPQLTVLYDGACGLCRKSAARLRQLDSRGRIELLDLREPAGPRRFPQVDPEEARRQMQAVDSRGRVYGGVEAWAQVGQVLGGWKRVAWLLRAPGMRFLAEKIYAWVARNRHRWNPLASSNAVCALHGGDPGSAGVRRSDDK